MPKDVASEDAGGYHVVKCSVDYFLTVSYSLFPRIFSVFNMAAAQVLLRAASHPHIENREVPGGEVESQSAVVTITLISI